MTRRVTPITRDPVEREAAKCRLAGDELGALEVLVADLARRLRRLDARLSASPCAAFRKAAEEQRQAEDEKHRRKTTLSVVQIATREVDTR